MFVTEFALATAYCVASTLFVSPSDTVTVRTSSSTEYDVAAETIPADSVARNATMSLFAQATE
jgi:hypothetical protein